MRYILFFTLSFFISVQWSCKEAHQNSRIESSEDLEGEDLLAGEQTVDQPIDQDQPVDQPIDQPIDQPTTSPPEDCLTHEDFFLERVWRPIVKPLCLDCHNPQGAAQASDMVYVSEEQLGFEEVNYQVFADIADFDRGGEPIVLLKPTASIMHGGGQLFERESEPYLALKEMVERARDEEQVVCEEDPLDLEDDLFHGVELLGPQETLRRATLSLAGRLPTQEEEEMITRYGWGGVERGLNQVMHSEKFYLRMKELWNDILLTDKYLGRNNAVDLLNVEQYPNSKWHINATHTAQLDEMYWAAVDFTNDSLAREPLEHIAFIIREDRPFSEIISSDYIVMNPFTARLYGVEDIEWTNPLDPQEFREGRVPNIPHSGILTSPMFLNRYPTTDTNRNRHRARIFFKLFLDLNVLKLAERPIDPTSTAHNPTMNDPQCSICHTVIDPVAGAFQHWDIQGGFSFREAWYGDMRAPGFGQDLLPFEERTASLRWLALQTAADDRFDRSIVRLMYQMIIGDDLLSSPTEGDWMEDQMIAFEHQQQFVDSMARGFRANQQNLKWLIKALIRSPYFRAVGLTTEMMENLTDGQHVQIEHLGLTKPLTPEQLNRKLYTTTGVRWRASHTSIDYLLDPNQYKLLYGGIDSDDVVERIRTPNGIFANIQRRMANEMACKVTAYDFGLPTEERLLFPWVETTYEPEDSNGFPIPQVQEMIKLNLQHLAWRLWGKRWSLDHPEVEALFEVFIDVWRLGKAEIERGELSPNITYACQGRTDPLNDFTLPEDRQVITDPSYVVRAWEATLTLFFNDYFFLYE